jgi:hypothetical protein
VAVLGTAVLVIVGLRIVLVIPAAIVTKTAVFGSCLPSGLGSPLYSYSFTLCPSFSFPFLIPPPLAEQFCRNNIGLLHEYSTQIVQMAIRRELLKY